MKNDPIETALALLGEVALHTPHGRAQMEKALASKFSLVAAKAARIAADAQWTELRGALAAAFDRLLQADNNADKGCAAKTAIARALVRVDYDDPDLFRRGMKRVQMEPTWGGSEDRASELRAACAMGLVNSTFASKVSDLVELLADREAPARTGAARALGALGGEAAAMVLKCKCLLGDDSADVLSECWAGLLHADLREGLTVALSAAQTENAERREAAILALGASRHPEAVAKLKELFQEAASPKIRACVLLALATSRTEPAVDFLLDLIRNGSPSACVLAINAVGLYREDFRFRRNARQALDSRSDNAGSEAWRALFGR